MWGGGTEQTTSSTGSNNPAVDQTVTSLLTGLQNDMSKGYAVYNDTLNPGAGDTTKAGWQSMLSGANNPDYNRGVSGAMSEFSDIAAGNRFGEQAPGYAAMREGVSNDVIAGTNAAFNASGRFGGQSNVEDVSRGLTRELGSMDYQNYQNDVARQERAVGMLPSIYSASMAPAQVQAGVGAQQDANSLALRLADNDLFRRQKDAGWTGAGMASSILAGTAGAAGQTTTNTSPATPWWMAPAQIAASAF